MTFNNFLFSLSTSECTQHSKLRLKIEQIKLQVRERHHAEKMSAAHKLNSILEKLVNQKQDSSAKSSSETRCLSETMTPLLSRREEAKERRHRERLEMANRFSDLLEQILK